MYSGLKSKTTLNKLESLIRKTRKEGFYNLIEIQEVKLYFQCQHCGRCCTNLSVVLTGQEAEKNLLKANSHLNQFYLNELNKSKQSCVFLEKRKDKYYCSIYNERPLLCKAYPFYLHPINGKLYVDQSCPGVTIGKNDTLDRERINRRVVELKDRFLKDIIKDLPMRARQALLFKYSTLLFRKRKNIVNSGGVGAGYMERVF